MSNAPVLQTSLNAPGAAGIHLILTMKREVCILFISVIMWIRADKDYCSITCYGKKHTMCTYQDELPGPNCNEFKDERLSKEEKATIITKHNELRNRVAAGKQTPQPPASNMMQLEWDDELETIAQRWANQCNFAHDDCRNTGANDWVGQNIAYSGKSSRFSSQLEGHILRWFGEVNDTRPSVVRSFEAKRDPDVPQIGHYTQMVYAETRYIGCGRSFYVSENRGRMYKELLVCNYKPGGNLHKEPLYIVGDPCSNCPEGTACSSTYPALCSTKPKRSLVQGATSGSTIQAKKNSLWWIFLIISILVINKM